MVPSDKPIVDFGTHDEPLFRGNLRNSFVAIVFLACWILPPLWRIVTLQSVNIQDDVFTSDLLNAGVPFRAFFGESVRRGELPLWSPAIYTGFPILAQAEHGPFYPFNWLFFSLWPPYVAVAFAQVLPLFIGGLGLFLLAREWRLPMGPALFAAGTFGLSGFFIAHMRHLSMNDAACWIPHLFLWGDRVIGGRSKYAPLVLALLWALQISAGHLQISFYTGILLAPFLIARAVQMDSTLPDGFWSWPRHIIQNPGLQKAACALLVGLLLMLVQLVPCWELAQLTHRKDFSYTEASAFPASTRDFLTFFVPYLEGHAGTGPVGTQGIFWERYGYLGLLPMLFAIAGTIAGWPRFRLVKLVAITVLLSYFMYLGKNTPIFKLGCVLIPGLSSFRFPTRFLIFIELGLALLAGFGMSWVSDKLRDRRRRFVLWFVATTITAWDLWTNQMRQVPEVSWSEWNAPIETADFLAKERERSPGPWRYLALDSMNLHEMAFRQARGWVDTSPYVRHRDMLQPSTNLLYGLESVDGYIQLVPREYETLWGSGWQNGKISPPASWIEENGHVAKPFLNALRAFNVRYLLSSRELQNPSLTLAFQARSGVRIYEIADPLPRAFVVARTLPKASEEEAVAALLSETFEPRAEVIVPPPLFEEPSGSANSTNIHFERNGNTETKVHVSLREPGLLVVSEGFYPGWSATMDGVDVPIVRANLMMRSVSVAAGEHEVVFRFSPWSIKVGFAGTLVGILVFLLILPRLSRYGFRASMEVGHEHDRGASRAG